MKKKYCDIYKNYFNLCSEQECINARECLFMDLYGFKLHGLREKFHVPKRVQALVDLGHKKECACCGSKKWLTFDHVQPLSKKGKDSNENGQILCHRCNNRKGNLCISLNELRQLIKLNIKTY